MNNLRETEQNFLFNLLNIIWQSQRNPQIIYPILQANSDKLTVDFAVRLRYWGESQIRQSLPERSQTIAALLTWLSDLILYFPLGDKTANIAVAKSGYECGLIFYTPETNPFAWAEIMMNLGIAYEEEPEADPAQKWEDAIACYQKASQVFTREVDPEKWASIQENLGNAYRNREQGKVEINLQQAIAFYQKALEIFNPAQHPKQWGVAQHNLGQVYFKLSLFNIQESSQDYEQCLQTAIVHYEQALQTLAKDVYPDLWALSHMSLGHAYSYLLRVNPYQNYEKAQQHYENALSVYTPQTYPFYYQQVKAGQQGIQELIKVISESESKREYKEDFYFIIEALSLTLGSQGDVQKVFAFLEKNLDKLNQDSPREISAFISDLVKTKSKQLPVFMEAIAQFSALMYIFPGGNREVNLNIAITGWHLVSSLPGQSSDLSSEVSHLFGMMKLYLGSAFYEKYQNRWGERGVNLEEAIKSFAEAFAILDEEAIKSFAKTVTDWDEEAVKFIEEALAKLDGESIQPSEKAFDVLNNAGNTERNFWASCQNKLGVCYSERYQIKGETDDLEKAIIAYESALKVYPENTLDWAMVQMNLGNIYCVRQGDPLENLTSGIKYYEKSLTVRKEETYPTEWADVQLNLGSAYYRRGMLGHSESTEDIEKSIKCKLNALKFYSNPSEYPQRWAGLQNDLGVCYSDRRIGNYADNLESAIQHFNQAITVITPQKDPYHWARILNNLGVIYRQRKQGGRGDRLTNLRLAIDCYEQALQVFTPEKYPIDWAQTQGNLATTYRVIAENINPKENLKKAMACANNAERIFRKNYQQWAKIQFELGTCYKNMGVFAKENPDENLSKAIECYQNALNLTSSASNPFGWAEITNSLGNAYQHNGQYQEAIKCFEDTLKLHTREALPTDYIKTQVNVGNAHIKNNELIKAFNSYEEAINTLEDLLSQLATDDDAKRKLGEEWVRAYQYMVVACLKLGKQNREYYATAWEYVERSKARRLVELFGQTKPQDVSDDVWKDFQYLRNQINNEQQWIEYREKSSIFSVENLSKQAELECRKIRLTNLKQQLNQKITRYPKLASAQRVQYTPFSKIGEKLSDAHTVIIQWYLLESEQKFCAFIYTRQSFQPYIWESSLEDLERLVQWYQEYLSTYGQWTDELAELLERLANILHIDEILALLPSTCKQVILIPHRYLHLFPIHALPVSQQTWKRFNPKKDASTNPCLLDCFETGVCYSPSFQALMAIQNRKRPNFNQLFAIQNPTKDLDYADLEVEAVLNYFDSNYRKVFANEEANKANITFTEYLNNAHCIHFSCHGTFNPESPIESGLILANKEILTLGEIFGFDLRQCRLVVLSACETGMIDPSSITDEYIGLTSGFLYAGSPSVVSTLWSVYQDSAAFLIIKLYENLIKQKDNKNVVVALKEAQLWLRNVTKEELRKWTSELYLDNVLKKVIMRQFSQIIDNSKPFASPIHWAAFCSIGQ